MQRRDFLKGSLVTGLATGTLTSTAGAEGETPKGAAMAGAAVVSGPAPESLSILQPIRRPATGFLEIAVGCGRPCADGSAEA